MIVQYFSVFINSNNITVDTLDALSTISLLNAIARTAFMVNPALKFNRER